MYYKKINENIYFDTFGKRYVSFPLKTRSLDSLSISDISQIKKINSRFTLNIIVTITSECDLACKYCFENHLVRKAMSIDTCYFLLNEIKDYIENDSIKNINCVLFGGEPMINKRVLKFFTLELNKLCRKMKVKLSILLTINGIIYDEKFLKELYLNGVKEIQLTFDGLEKTNNNRRCSKNVNINPYKKIMSNLNGFTEIFDQVNVKYNFDMDNYLEYPLFLDDLKKNSDIKKITIILETIHETVFGDYEKSYNLLSKELALQFISMIKLTIKKGLKYRTKIFLTPCMHTNYNSYLIDPEGVAYSCISSYGLSEFEIGEFSGNISETSKLKREKYERLGELKSHCKVVSIFPFAGGDVHI